MHPPLENSTTRIAIQPKAQSMFDKKSPAQDFGTMTLPTCKSQASYDKMTNGAATIHVVKESKITPTTPRIYFTWVVEF